MIPTRELWQSIIDAAAADTAYLAAATAMHLHLAQNAFTPGLELVLGDLTEATFTGSAALNAGTGAQPVGFDVATGFEIILVKEPAGGWTWTCTVAPTPEETIYGWYLTDTADAVLLGSGLLDNPLTINTVGQTLHVPRVTLSFAETSPF